MQSRLRTLFALCSVSLTTTVMIACSSDQASTPGPNANTGGTGGSGGTTNTGGMDAGGSGGDDASTGGGGTGGGGTGGSGGGSCAPDTGTFTCPTTFTFDPGASVASVVVAGEWDAFDLAKAAPMTPASGGTYTATVALPPGLHGYKYVVNGTDWRLDPTQGRRKYVGTVENSGIKVPNCRLPSFAVQSSAVTRPAQGQGKYEASLAFVDGTEGSGADVGGYAVTLERNGTATPIDAGSVVVDPSGNVSVSIGNLQDGKYRLVVQGRTKNCRVGEPLRLVFWVEPEAFSWKDALIYMVMTDRYKDGDVSNNGPQTPGADPRGDWQGGDLEGLRQQIAAGTLDELGIRAIWLTPFQTNPTGAYMAADGVHQVTGYHGYWPVKAREVEARIGGEAALKALVAEAHAHGIRILQDFVLNHVHENHEYLLTHPDWFRTGCVCGTSGCDWTDHALDCMFATYMPDVNHTVPAANAQFVADAVWWLDTFDLDGIRVDAVKHVEEIATRNLVAEVRETFEGAGTRYFMMGETAMGWKDCNDPCNDENYGTISKYIGPYGLDGQFDFVLYHGVSYRTFAWSEKGMLHADYWVQHGLQKYPSDAIMTPYIGSHDTSRFATMADPDNSSKAGNQWDNIASAPTSVEAYEKTRLGFAWLLGLPGAPLMYYGDEYGQWGSSDPNNRTMWRGSTDLNANETATLEFVRKAGKARRDVPALRRGNYVSLAVTEDTLVFGRLLSPGNAAIVALTRASSAQPATVDVGTKLGLATGTVLHDRMGGPDVIVGAGGTVMLTVPAKGAMVLAP